MKITKQMRYASIINDKLASIFINEEDEAELDLNTVDLTEFFIAYVKAGGLFFNKLTREDKNSLEFTHLLNQLIVQDLLKKDDK